MASALASPPPPFSIGPGADLKANARKFLERALVISALAHLVAVGVFRAALERFASAGDQEIATVIPHWSDPTHIIPIHPIPKSFNPPVGSRSREGIVDPVDAKQVLYTFGHGPQGTEFDPIAAEPGGGTGPGPEPPAPPREEPGFTPAETPPVPLVMPHPAYPSWAREAGIEGKVLVRLLVGTDGVPKKAVIVRGPKGLTEGVEATMLHWRFRPGLANGQPVEVWVEIPISFKLGD